MKYIKIVNILIIVMLLSTIMVDSVKASSDFYRININMNVISVPPDDCSWRRGNALGNAWINDNPLPVRNLGLGHNSFSYVVNHEINTIRLATQGGGTSTRVYVVNSLSFRIYKGNELMASGSGWDTYHLNLPQPPRIINLSCALNFTLAGAMIFPTMSIGVVDDIMLIVGRYIQCGLTKFTIRAALLKATAKGVAIITAITAVGYLFSEFADDIYNDFFVTIPEIDPGATHFYETDIPQIMNVIDTHYPVLPHVRNAIEQDIRAHIDAQGLIAIADVMQIIRNHQNNTVIDIYQEIPEILPENIVVNRDQVPEIMDMIDEYFPVELPLRNIIEEEIYRRIDDNEFNEIPFSEVIDIIEEEQNLFIPEVPVETPEEHEEYIDEIIDRVEDEDPYIIPIIETPPLYEGIPTTPIIPRTPARPKEEIHTFPFYDIFVDPLASVIGITLAHLFAAMMIIGTIISIAVSWGSTGAILGGFMGTIITSYFGLTSWLIPLYLVVVFIIYMNIRIRKGGANE